MKALQRHLVEYIAARWALGTRLKEPAQTLLQFITFLARKRSSYITTPLALEWSQRSKNVQRATWARKLSMVRQFARWVHAIEPRHQVPPPRLLAVRHRRNPPHIYSDEQIVSLMVAASKLGSTKGMQALSLQTIIGLLAATGLRPGEAFALQRKDVDLQTGMLIIRESKFGKSRQVPVHPSTVVALECYARQRDIIFRRPDSSHFFLSEQGTALIAGAVRSWFCTISRSCGLRKKIPGHRCGRGPRLQDLRHTFATRRLVEWYRAGENVAIQLPKLATYLGHSSVGCTYWYIQAVPELLALATDFQLTARPGGRL
jgi:integrase